MKKCKKTRLLPMAVLKARPCEVDGVPALFHRWVEEDSVLLNIDRLCTPEDRLRLSHEYLRDRVVPAGCTSAVLHHTFALVEYRDGTIGKVAPESVRFVDKEARV